MSSKLHKYNFGVLGAGVVGLTTALELQAEFPSSQIVLLADQFDDKTTSFVAAGIFRPGTSFSGPTESLTRKWVQDAYNYWDDILQKTDSSLAGICQLSGYIFSKINKNIVKNSLMKNIVPVYRNVTDEELGLCNGGWKYGSFFTTILTEPRLFLQYATKKFKENGGLIIQYRANSFEEFGNKFDILFNCTGLGAKDLCYDRKLVPIRGQVIKVIAPWIKMAFYGDFDTYVIPGFEGVTLGGCRQYESYNLDVCNYDSAAIYERCCKMLPSLKDVKIIRQNVGLRPHRDQVRVEKEMLNFQNGKSVKVIHNYGHGGYGVTTAPGTAKYAIKLARDLLSSSNSKL